MIDFIPIPIVWIRAAAMTLAIIVVGVFFLGRCSAPDPTPLPPKVEAQLERHRLATAVDTAETNRLARDEAAARARQQAAAVVRQELELAAAVEHARADSLAEVAAAVVKSADSSSWAWQQAYQARTFEAMSWKRSLDSAKAETGHAGIAGAKADTIAAVDLRRAVRADSVIAAVVDVAMHPNRCTVGWILPCPTRKQAFVGGLLVGAAGVALASGKIKIPIALKF